MDQWKIQCPQSQALEDDHAVPRISSLLHNMNIAVLVSGGIAAMKAPSFVRLLRRHGANVVCYVSEEAKRYVTIHTLEWASTNRVIDHLSSDSEHLSGNMPFDAYLLAPATYNTINKFAYGIADGVLTTTLAYAFGLCEQRKTSIIVAPTMHGDMHNGILEQSLRRLAEYGVVICPPRDDYRKHNIPDSNNLCSFVIRTIYRRINSTPRSVLVSYGSIPSLLDDLRIITNPFKGRIGQAIAEGLHLLGHEVSAVCGPSAVKSKLLAERVCQVQDFDSYRENVHRLLQQAEIDYAVLSAAVADFSPTEKGKGKISTEEKKDLTLTLRVNPKVVDEVISRHPATAVVSFKLEYDASKEGLVEIANRRLARGHRAVFANTYKSLVASGANGFLITKHGTTRCETFHELITSVVQEIDPVFADRINPNLT
jgi:phosphopantothenoylcysteine decarboxylase / phosphopantothenate---cysteine ligase